jgi:hypothetical protein
LAYEPDTSSIYWSDVSDRRIFRSDLSFANTTLILNTGGRAYGMDFNSADQMLYFTDWDNGQVRRVRNDGTGEETLLGSSLANQLAVNGDSRLIYWGKASSSTTESGVWSASLSGQNSNALVEPTGNGVGGIAVDPLVGKVFWTQSLRSGIAPKLMSADLDGSNILDVYTLPGSTSPRGLGGVALDTLEQRVYWTNLQGTLLSSFYDGSDLRTVATGIPTGDLMLVRFINVPEPSTFASASLLLTAAMLQQRRGSLAT